MIKRLEPKDIVKITTLKDNDFEEIMSCDVGGWTQFLIQNAQNDAFFMAGNIEDNKLKGYIIAYFVALPICQDVTVIYSKIEGSNKDKEMIEDLKIWSKEKGAKSINFVTNNIKDYLAFGFEKKATMVGMEL